MVYGIKLYKIQKWIRDPSSCKMREALGIKSGSFAFCRSSLFLDQTCAVSSSSFHLVRERNINLVRFFSLKFLGTGSEHKLEREKWRKKISQNKKKRLTKHRNRDRKADLSYRVLFSEFKSWTIKLAEGDWESANFSIPRWIYVCTIFFIL